MGRDAKAMVVFAVRERKRGHQHAANQGRGGRDIVGFTTYWHLLFGMA